MDILDRVNYSPIIDHAFSNIIREYDMKKANISILYTIGEISKSEYDYLYNASREERQRTIGIMELKDKSLYKKLSNGVLEYRRKFIEENDIPLYNILTLKNDAIFLLNKNANITKFGDYIEFVNKNTYTSYFRLGTVDKIEVYYYYDRVNDDEIIDVKGIGKNIDYHKEYMIDFISYLFSIIESQSLEIAIAVLCDFYIEYINLELDINYYRPLNASSMYEFNNGYKVSHLDNSITSKQSIDINYNMMILRQIQKYVSLELFNKKNHS